MVLPARLSEHVPKVEADPGGLPAQPQERPVPPRRGNEARQVPVLGPGVEDHTLRCHAEFAQRQVLGLVHWRHGRPAARAGGVRRWGRRSAEVAAVGKRRAHGDEQWPLRGRPLYDRAGGQANLELRPLQCLERDRMGDGRGCYCAQRRHGAVFECGGPTGHQGQRTHQHHVVHLHRAVLVRHLGLGRTELRRQHRSRREKRVQVPRDLWPALSGCRQVGRGRTGALGLLQGQHRPEVGVHGRRFHQERNRCPEVPHYR
mmetsp:Transcript_79081/g.256453  ORF Transcript_79081/g.256453 Transcript_79081/m.256453 type:complete len:259 (-) Transcript_79081:813-1589(-)